jgi:hypothetical protein
MFKHPFNSYKEPFEMLPRLLLAIKESNLEMVIEWDHKENLYDSTMVFGDFFDHLDISLKVSIIVGHSYVWVI